MIDAIEKEGIDALRNQIVCGNALDVLKQMPDDCIDMIITSPPYYGLRLYKTPPQVWGSDPNCRHEWGDSITYRMSGGIPGCSVDRDGWRRFESQSVFCRKCNAWEGELGLEPSFDGPNGYVAHIVQIMNECKRVLKKTGSLYLNLADHYTRKSLDMIPYRVALSMCDSGWILRNQLIWFKSNCMPSSVCDRYTIDFEPIFFFVKSQRYFFEQQFEPYQSSMKMRMQYDKLAPGSKGATGKYAMRTKDYIIGLGRNKRCVWDIPLRGGSHGDEATQMHFAVFPESLVTTPILASCPQYVCVKCQTPRKKIYKVVGKVKVHAFGGVKHVEGDENLNHGNYTGKDEQLIKEFAGYSDCGCGAGWKPGIVLDPFMGSGTTAVVAKKLGRDYIGIELNENYAKAADKRVSSQTPVLAFEP